MTSTNNGVELLISLNIDNQKSKQNVDKYIESLQKQLEDLDVTLMVKGDTSNNKVFKQMEQQITTLQNQVKELNKQLGNIGSGKTSNSGSVSIAIGKDLKEAQDMITNFLKNAGHQIFDIKINADVTEGERVLKSFVANIKDAEGEVRKLTFMPDGKGSFQEIKETLNDNTISQYNNVLKDINETMASVHRSGMLGAETIQDFNSKIAQINNSDITLDDKIAKLRRELSLLSNEMDETAFQNKLTKAMQDAEISVRNLSSSLTKSTQTYKREATKMKTETESLRKEIDGLSKIPLFRNQKDIDNFNSKLKQTQSNIREYNARITEANRGSLTLGQSLKIAFERFPLWLGVSSIIFGIGNAVKSLVSNVVELDTALVDLQRVMDAPNYVFNNMLEQSIENVDALSGKLTDYMTLVTEFARMGFNETQALDMSNTAQTLQNISDLNAEESVDSLVAAMTSFNIAAEESVTIADKLNEVDNQYSITTKDLALSMNKASSTAKTFGVSLDELLGLTTAIGSATRESGNIVGNSLKTIFSRTTTNDNAISALSAIGVSINDMEGNIRPVGDIIEEVAGKWTSLSDAQRQNTAVGVAGIYQLSR